MKDLNPKLLSYQPYGETLLVTGVYVKDIDNEILAETAKKTINNFQTIVALGNKADSDFFKVGDIVEIDFSSMRDLNNKIVVMDPSDISESGEVNVMYVIVPTYLIKGVVTISQEDKELLISK